MMPMRSLGNMSIAMRAVSALRVIIGSTIMLSILGLAGCAGPTGYVKASSRVLSSSRYGYSDKRISDDEFSIVVLGNSRTSEARAAEIALLRAAHLTKEEGRTHFVIMKQKAVATEATVLHEFVYPMVIGTGIILPVSVPVGEHTTNEPMAILLIRLLPVQPTYSPEALSAAEVIEHVTKQLESD
jgi:hypothetical protein